jgi:hypothetical protein
MKSDLQVLSAFLPAWQSDHGVSVCEPLTALSKLVTPLSFRAGPNARPAFEVQPRKEIKIKRMTPFF